MHNTHLKEHRVLWPSAHCIERLVPTVSWDKGVLVSGSQLFVSQSTLNLAREIPLSL